MAVEQMGLALKNINAETYSLDEFGTTNIKVFDEQEKNYSTSSMYNVLSLFCIALLDLGLISIE
ncbi:hypothetical protein RBH29_15940 [Herbivorax sp. ANBcel31]|uniref:hypothetical protein n=1 Tax=Herbivorax sp. ANBcel31 TaxID=3069754 RepID=UPI0027B0246E|nr:hypothetical protein [Herbivorax sp. ANBcel31]MDQ2087921.1 hypothetical protein [Herbivorax sp. ANBcel31]